jgi:hypothetical protein
MRHAAVLLLLSSFLAVPALADSCQWQDDPPYNYVFVCYPTYGYPMYQQPDYSLYSIGTIWWFHKTSGNIDTWYATDTGETPACCPDGPNIQQNTGQIIPRDLCQYLFALFGDHSEVTRYRCVNTSSGYQSTWQITYCDRDVYCPNPNNCQAQNSPTTLPCP